MKKVHQQGDMAAQGSLKGWISRIPLTMLRIESGRRATLLSSAHEGPPLCHSRAIRMVWPDGREAIMNESSLLSIGKQWNEMPVQPHHL